ncbi:MAG: MarR family winged helix-turn-helix transcriptional regulator [Bdellovibrio bacteriovorus]
MSETNGAELHDYLERLCNLARSEARALVADPGLQPVQLEALRYLARCNRYSNTPLAVAEYLGSTKGTISQTLMALESKGLVTKEADARDRRVIHLEPTPRGLAVLAGAVPGPMLRRAAEALAGPPLETLVAGLRGLLRGIQTAHGLRSFGACASCRFNGRTSEGYQCGLTGEALAESDLRKICREHAYPPAAI